MTNVEKKQEAIARMKMWGIFKPIIKQFEEDDLISESAPPFGACFWLNDEQLARVREFEKEHNAVVYHVIHSYTEFGELENYLYVSNYPEEWEMDREDIKTGQQLVYVYNHDTPEFSEFGSIGIRRTVAGGLQRIW